MAILVTGGAGFIGSHTCVELLEAGYEVVIADNLYNASKKAVDRIEEITGKKVKFYETDIRDRAGMDAIFEAESIEAVIHFAGLKAVGESVAKPLEYYENNIGGTLTLCDVMRSHNVKNIIYPDYGGMPEGYLHQSVRLDKMDAGADSHRPTHSGCRVECGPAQVLQSRRGTQER